MEDVTVLVWAVFRHEKMRKYCPNQYTGVDNRISINKRHVFLVTNLPWSVESAINRPLFSTQIEVPRTFEVDYRILNISTHFLLKS